MFFNNEESQFFTTFNNAFQFYLRFFNYLPGANSTSSQPYWKTPPTYICKFVCSAASVTLLNIQFLLHSD